MLNAVLKAFPNSEVIAFGSRVSGRPRTNSDLDICVRAAGALDLRKWAHLEEELTQSDLPFKVDLVDWHRATPEFQRVIADSGVTWEKCP
ncbi:MAG: nucleotidyltransferase domain-containing protein [Bdellovibrionales bacterium]|nr:nucleotidyltransferase domain-containing protein [Bdellovibrionales bacterium]